MTSPEPPGDDSLHIEVRTRLDAATVAAVQQVTAAATDLDGVYPLSEHVALHLRHGGDAHARHLVAWAPPPSGAVNELMVVGYAHLDVTDDVAGASAEVVVDPARRGQGIGRALVERLVAETPDGRIRLWAHGTHPASRRLAAQLGFVQTRQLWQMRRSLLAPLPPAPLPDGITVRTFEPGRDDSEWVRVNARAFVEHPEQGGWTVADLQLRQRESWFDPAGFFLAERDGILVGYHWTKVHGAVHAHSGDEQHVHTEDHAHEPIGEVYVVGIDPDAQGIGLGPALTRIGLAHLRRLGLAQAMLYVEEENTHAIRVYERLGFSRWTVDVSFTRDTRPTARP